MQGTEARLKTANELPDRQSALAGYPNQSGRDDVRLVSPGRDDDHWYIAQPLVGAHPREQRVAIHVGHQEVHQHEIRAFRPSLRALPRRNTP